MRQVDLDRGDKALQDAIQFATKYTDEDSLRVAQAYFKRGWQAHDSYNRLEELRNWRPRKPDKVLRFLDWCLGFLAGFATYLIVSHLPGGL